MELLEWVRFWIGECSLFQTRLSGGDYGGRCNNSKAWLCLDSNLSTSYYTTQAISN